MASKTKLLLVSCSGEETASLATEIFKILKESYGLEEVELLHSLRQREVDKEARKDHRHELVDDFFVDGEIDVAIGRNQFYDHLRGKHIALVEHLLTPDRKMHPKETQKVSVNDHIMNVRGFLDVLKHIETPQRSLVAPYLTYVRAHSVDKYEKRGFFQFDSLTKTLKDYQRDGLSAIVTIDLHSEKAIHIAEGLELEIHNVSPFQSARAINPYKLGLSGEKGPEVLKRLRPFQERFLTLKTDQNHLYLVVVDDGTETRVENFAERAFPELPPEEVYKRVVYFGKDRPSYGSSLLRPKGFSQIRKGSYDPKGNYIILDDMAASTGTANTVAKSIKEEAGSTSRVELWTSHAVTMPLQHELANDRNYIDKVVTLDTIPQHPELKFEYILASADLLAAGLYKAHKKLLDKRDEL